MKREDIARLIDHTLLKPEAMPEQIERLCDEARAYQFATVCVNPIYVGLAVDRLAGSGVAVCAVVAFPLGATTTATKVYEARQILNEGGREVDMVISIGALKAGQHTAVADDIAQVAAACHGEDALLKVILETALLTDEEKVTACRLAASAGADFVKTSTGFSSGGATLEDVRLMRRTVGPDIGVKAAGGIRSYADAVVMIEAGASRIGASAGVAIVEQAPA
jgi:deoxyribose-phosphate aldolase